MSVSIAGVIEIPDEGLGRYGIVNIESGEKCARVIAPIVAASRVGAELSSSLPRRGAPP